MMLLLVITLAISLTNGQHGDMGGGMGGGMGSGNGMGSGYGMGSNGMGSNGMGGMGSNSGMGNGMGYGGMGSGMDGECCPSKKIWGSMNPQMDGMYVNVGQMSWNKLPMRCNSPCVYKRKGANNGMKYCFGDSQFSQSQCDAGMDDGEEPVDMGPGSGSEDGEFPVDMGPGSGSCMGSVVWDQVAWNL